MLKKLKMIVITCVFTIAVCNVKVQAAQDNLIVNKNKIWTIKFNKEVQLDESTKNEIKVKDSKGQPVNCNFKLGNNNKSIIVDAPAGGYNPEEKYTLTVGNNIYSKKKAKLKSGKTMEFTVKKYDDNAIIVFKDKYFEKTVRDAIKKPTGTLYQKDVEKITNLNDVDANVRNIDGIEHLINLQGLWMSQAKVKDISPLRNLTKLQLINAIDCDINDISPLKDMKSLTNLYLDTNNISDISPLKGLVNLKTLYLQDNNISDITPLSGLTNLEELLLYNNNITNLKPLINLKKLDQLFLMANNNSRISIKGEPELKKLLNSISSKDYKIDSNDNVIPNF